MSRDNQLITYVDDAEYQQVQEWSDETGKSVSELVRMAVLEYTDHDRLERVEEKVDEVLARLDSDTTHTHKPESDMNQTSASPAVERARDIIRRLQSNHGDVVKATVVEEAIEDIAGMDDRTKRKYKQMFRRRGLLFEHPGQPPTWTFSTEQWQSWVADYANLNGKDEAERVIEQYPVTITAIVDGGYRIKMEDTK